MSEPNWIVTWGVGIRCNRCTMTAEVPEPFDAKKWHNIVEAFVTKHAKCPEKKK